MTNFVSVTTVNEFPTPRARTLVLQTAEIVNAEQEYRSIGPIGVTDDGFSILTPEEAAEYYYATPVIHIWLKYNLRVFPVQNQGQFVDEDKWDQTPKDRPTEIWIDGILEDFFFLINEEDGGGGGIDALDDLNVQVDITVDGPVGGTNTWLLPVAWKDKRFRVFRNGDKFLNWIKTASDPKDIFELSVAGDVFMGTAIQPGFEEIFSFENY